MAEYIKGNWVSKDVEISNGFVMTWSTPANPYIVDGKIDLKYELKSIQLLKLKENYRLNPSIMLGIIFLCLLMSHIGPASLSPFFGLAFILVLVLAPANDDGGKPENNLTLTVGCEIMNGNKCLLKVKGSEYLILKTFAKVESKVEENLYYAKNSKIDFSDYITPYCYGSEENGMCDKTKTLQEIDRLKALKDNKEIDEEYFNNKKHEILATI